jgi:hypothetical protein
VQKIVANLHWGGPGCGTLFITPLTSLYALEISVGPHKESFMNGHRLVLTQRTEVHAAHSRRNAMCVAHAAIKVKRGREEAAHSVFKGR